MKNGFLGICLLVIGLPSDALAQSGDGQLVAKARKEVRECLAEEGPEGWKLNSSVNVTGSCIAGGFITEVNFYKSYPCKPNRICPAIAPYRLASVTFGCENEVIYAQCHATTCIDDAFCGADEWCRPTEYKHAECTPYVGEGETCGGYVLPEFYEICEEGLVCTSDPWIPDLQGTCATCDYEGTGYAAGDSWIANDGCNTCFCSDTGAIGCTKIACPVP